jgi:pantoate--beta-alanine ligase
VTIAVINDPAAMRARSSAWHCSGLRVAFVPTMGYLHAGHLSLLEAGRRLSDVLVLSIFVNPTQFGPSEDLSRYPRDLESDLGQAERAGVDVAFVPPQTAMYPPGFQTYVEVRELERGLCGDRRPGHFRGVATVVLKLIHLVQPTVILLGEKDFQQLQVLRRMVRDLDLDIEVVGMPIVREADGLAMSSRNAYLSPAERVRALELSHALEAARALFVAGERAAPVLLRGARDVLERAAAEGGLRLEYLELCDAETLKRVDGAVERPAVLALAAFVGSTRLIDNVVLTP